MTVLVTEAYTPNNLGDLELVARTYEAAARWHSDEDIVVVAVDPGGFSRARPSWRVEPKLFPRLDVTQRSAIATAKTLLRWALQCSAMSLLVLLPGKVARHAIRVGSRARLWSGSARIYCSASNVLAVGGGYLGDQYAKETVLTLWTWWWAGRLGASVVTMPISVEIHGRGLKLLLRVLGRRVKWTVRDRASQEAVRSVGLRCDYAPDLAFQNLGPVISGTRRREGVLICPVGRDYLHDDDIRRIHSHLSAGVSATLKPGTPVGLIGMHRRVGDTSIGGDDASVRELADCLSAQGYPVEVHAPREYKDVLAAAWQYEAIVSARMHAGIAGLCAHAKVGLLAYEEKHGALFSDMGLQDYVIEIRANENDYTQLFQRLSRANAADFLRPSEEHARRLSEWLQAAEV